MAEASRLEDSAPITVAPIAGALGAEIGGVDLSEELPEGTMCTAVSPSRKLRSGSERVS